MKKTFAIDFTDNSTAFDSKFPANEIVSTNIIPYDNESGTFTDGEYVRNYKLEYGNNSGEFLLEDSFVRKLSFTNPVGAGFFQAGQVIRTTDTKAEVVGYNQARKTVYIGKIGRSQSTGQDYHTATFTNSAQIDRSTKKFGISSLLVGKAKTTHTFSSGVTDAITAGGGASGSFTAQSGTTYNPNTGVMVITIGTHGLTTSNTITIADN